MDLLHQMVLDKGLVYPNNVLKVDSFINHQIDAPLMHEVGLRFRYYFQKYNVTKVLTIEASGIAPGIMTALAFGVPMIFAKKTVPSTLKKDAFYSTDVFSYTKNISSTVILSKDYLSEDDRVLIIDDFLANGEAALGLSELVKQAGATTVGIGIVIEKSFQNGRQRLEEAGFDVYSQCRIASLDNEHVTFVEE